MVAVKPWHLMVCLLLTVIVVGLSIVAARRKR